MKRNVTQVKICFVKLTLEICKHSYFQISLFQEKAIEYLERLEEEEKIGFFLVFCLFTIFSSCKLICQSLFIPNMKISLLWQRFNQFEGFSPPPTQHWNNLLYCVYTKILVPDSLTPHLGIGPFSSVPPMNLETTLPWAEAVTEAQKPQYWLSLSIQGTGFQLCKPLL